MTNARVVEGLARKLAGSDRDKVILISLESIVSERTAGSGLLVVVVSVETGVSFAGRHRQVADASRSSRAADGRRHVASNMTPMVGGAGVEVGAGRARLSSAVGSNERTSFEARVRLALFVTGLLSQEVVLVSTESGVNEWLAGVGLWIVEEPLDLFISGSSRDLEFTGVAFSWAADRGCGRGADMTEETGRAARVGGAVGWREGDPLGAWVAEYGTLRLAGCLGEEVVLVSFATLVVELDAGHGCLVVVETWQRSATGSNHKGLAANVVTVDSSRTTDGCVHVGSVMTPISVAADVDVGGALKGAVGSQHLWLSESTWIVEFEAGSITILLGQEVVLSSAQSTVVERKAALSLLVPVPS